MQKNVSILLGLLFITLCFTGCANPVIKGTVKFDDGNPVDFGTLVFTNGDLSYAAKINKDGTFQTKDANYKGLPPGFYQVFISGAVEFHKIISADGKKLSFSSTYHLPKKYTLVGDSGLTFEVKRGGSKTYDIVIEKGGKEAKIDR